MAFTTFDLPRDLSVIGDWSFFYAALLMEQSNYQQQLVYRIDAQGRDHLCLNPDEVLNAQSLETIKIEGLESLPAFYGFARALEKAHFPQSPRELTIHLFYAHAGGYTFPLHTDPVDLILCCVEGSKAIDVSDTVVTVATGQGLYLPKNTPHRANNQQASMMLSIGFETRPCSVQSTLKQPTPVT